MENPKALNYVRDLLINCTRAAEDNTAGEGNCIAGIWPSGGVAISVNNSSFSFFLIDTPIGTRPGRLLSTNLFQPYLWTRQESNSPAIYQQVKRHPHTNCATRPVQQFFFPQI